MAGKRAPGRQTGSKNKKYKGNNRETMELSVQSSSSRSGKTAQKSSSKKAAAQKRAAVKKAQDLLRLREEVRQERHRDGTKEFQMRSQGSSCWHWGYFLLSLFIQM